MLLRRVSVFSILLFSLGGVMTLHHPKPNFFSPPITQSFAYTLSGNEVKPRLIDALEITSDQQQKLQAIREQYNEPIAEQNRQLQDATQELRALMTGAADTAQIRTKHEHVQQLRQQIENLNFESMLAMREVLTPDQRREFAQLMDQRRDQARNEMKHRMRQGEEF